MWLAEPVSSSSVSGLARYSAEDARLVPIAVMTIAKPVLESQHPSFARVRATGWSMSLRTTRWSKPGRRLS